MQLVGRTPGILDTTWSVLKGNKMTVSNDEQCRNLLISLRKIIQAIDQHSIALKKNFGLTGPQLVTLQAVCFYAPVSVTQISHIISLSQASVTDITQRLEKKGYLSRTRNLDDRRKTFIVPTKKGTDKLDAVPPLLQERFTERFSQLERWEQLMIESAFERVVSMMSAQDSEVLPTIRPENKQKVGGPK